MAHDFNNLLTVINGYVELAAEELPAGHPAAEALEHIEQAGRRATALTRQLLAFSRKQILKPEVLNLNHLVANMEKMLRRVIPENIHFVTQYSRRLPSVHADPGQLEQVLLNLVVNARDAMPRGGTLTISTEEARLEAEDEKLRPDVSRGNYVLLTVSDSGVGMDRETRERIFEPFFTTKQKGQGTGLGLATVYGIVKQSRGDIRVYSQPGKGTTFKIYLPVVDAVAEEQQSTKTKTAQGGTETIFLVEDHDDVRAFAENGLRKLGYRIYAFADGREALAFAREFSGKIDLLLTDIIMPHLGGKELAAEMQKLRGDLPVLYMSGYTDNTLAHRGLLGPGVKFLQKPFSLEKLNSAVRNTLS